MNFGCGKNLNLKFCYKYFSRFTVDVVKLQAFRFHIIQSLPCKKYEEESRLDEDEGHTTFKTRMRKGKNMKSYNL